MFDRITHGRKLKSQRYGKKGENQKGYRKGIRLSLLAISAQRGDILYWEWLSGPKKAEIKAVRSYLRFTTC
jgi:hypothetical protein